MYLRRILIAASLVAPLGLSAPGFSADEHQHDHQHRQHGTHVHGIGALNLVLEGKEVHIELDSPAANIVGFEHAPASEAERAALDRALALLMDGDRLFRFNDGADCQMETVDVASELLDDNHEEHEHQHEGHEEHADHDHEGHNDIEAAYHFECAAPGKLTQLTVELFEAFPNTHKLKLQYIIEHRQGAAELTSTRHVVKF